MCYQVNQEVSFMSVCFDPLHEFYYIAVLKASVLYPGQKSHQAFFKKRKEHNLFTNTSHWGRNKSHQLHSGTFTSVVLQQRGCTEGDNSGLYMWSRVDQILYFSLDFSTSLFAFYILEKASWENALLLMLWCCGLLVRNGEYDRLQRQKNWNVSCCNFCQIVLPLKCWQIFKADWATLHF